MTRVTVWWCGLCDQPVPAPQVVHTEVDYHLHNGAKHGVIERRLADTGTVTRDLGVDRKLLNDWVRRGLVEPPLRVGRTYWYSLDEARDAEQRTRDSDFTGRPRTVST